MEQLFGPRGACAGCWCMYWRRTNAEYKKNQGEGNRRAMKSLIERGIVPGILAYDGDTPIGWCSVAPREQFVRFETSRTLKPIDAQPVWSIACLFVAKGYRRKGISAQLLEAAAAYARSQGAKILEGYPRDPSKQEADPFLWTGTVPAFVKAGFTEMARPSETRAIMRRELRRK